MNNLFNPITYNPKNKSVLRILNDFEQKYDPIFSKVKSQWLPAIREFLREETGLRMHQKVVGTKIQKDINVSFNFVSDKNETFIKLIDQHYPDLDFDEYTAFNKLNLELKNSKYFFLEKHGDIAQSYIQLTNFLDQYFKKYDLNELLNTLFKNSGKSADIWGTYFYRDNRIEIYYIPLILFCQIYNLPIEHAILSVLVHEMAHAYHHLGKDKDNISWPTMISTDPKIVEGMAEYFTWLFVETYKGNHSRMEETYNCMFDCLGEEYTIFKSWTPTYSREAIKSALIGTRKKSVKQYKDFIFLIENIKKLMH